MEVIFIKDLKNQGKTIIISTHIFSLVEKLCDRIGIIKQGKLVAEGTMQEIAGDKSLESLFVELQNE